MIRKSIQDYLLTKHTKVYFKTADNDASFPYIVYDLILYDDGEFLKTGIIDIDIWDMPETGSTQAIEDLCDLINGNSSVTNPSGMDKAMLSDGNTLTTPNLETMYYIDDENKKIKRKRMSYNIKSYERG